MRLQANRLMITSLRITDKMKKVRLQATVAAVVMTTALLSAQVRSNALWVGLIATWGTAIMAGLLRIEIDE